MVIYATSQNGVVHWTFWGGEAACGARFGFVSHQGTQVLPRRHWEITVVDKQKPTTAKQAQRLFKATPCKRCFADTL